MKNINIAAKNHINFPINRDWDEEEDYYNPSAPKYHSFIEGAKSEVAKEYHTKNMYSEEEVKNLIQIAWATASAYGEYTNSKDCNDWFEHNKKK